MDVAYLGTGSLNARAEQITFDGDLLARWAPALLRLDEVPALHVHGLRHTHATLLLLAGKHPKVVQERLGHAQISVTLNTHSHMLPSLQRDAADAIGEFLGGLIVAPVVAQPAAEPQPESEKAPGTA